MSTYKIFVMTDLEGASGVTGRWDVFNPGGREHSSAKKHLTGDVNSAIEGILESGIPAEITVLDGHGGQFSIELDELNPCAKLIQGNRLDDLQGLDNSYDAMFIIGAHSMHGTSKGVLSHTFWSSRFTNLWLNGKPIGEVGIWSAWAGEFGVPTVLVAGDEDSINEARQILGNIETVAVKKGVSRYCAILEHPKVTSLKIKEAAKNAMKKIPEIKIWKPGPPFEMKLEFICPHDALSVSRRPDVILIDGRTVSYTGKTVRETIAMIWP